VDGLSGRQDRSSPLVFSFFLIFFFDRLTNLLRRVGNVGRQSCVRRFVCYAPTNIYRRLIFGSNLIWPAFLSYRTAGNKININIIHIYIYNFWMRKKEARVDNIILIINDTSGWDDHHRVDVDETGRLRPDGPHQSTQRPALNLDSKSVIFHGNIFRN